MPTPSAIGLKKGASGQDVTDLQDFLRVFGYLQPESTTGTFDDATEKALQSYQQFHGLPVTGELDRVTVAEMQKPRCGFPDKTISTGSNRFGVIGNRWNRTDLTYRIINSIFQFELSPATISAGVRQAFDLWSEVTPLTFTEVFTENADISIRFLPRNHRDGIVVRGGLAHASSPNGLDAPVEAHFNDDENWTVNVPPIPNNFSDNYDFVAVAAHEFGHCLGLDHSTVENALMFPVARNARVDVHRFLDQDDINGIQSIYGNRLIGWAELDNNPATVSIVADRVGNRVDLYQLHNNGRIWKYTGRPFSGWQELDNNPATKKIVAAAGNLYQIHQNGRIWQYTGTPFSGWLELNNNPASVDIVAADTFSGVDLYQLQNNGRIWKYTGAPFSGWQELDNNPATKKIVAAAGDLYQIHQNGRIWQYTGTPFSGWLELDNNPASVDIVADRDLFERRDLYQLHNNGRIWKYTGRPFSGWQELDNNPATKKIVAAAGNLYQIHQNGRIWKYTGTRFTGWTEVDNNPASVDIVAAGNDLYQLHNNGRIWKYLR